MANHQTVLVLDYGSQFTQLIARRVREQNVYCEIVPFDADPAELGAREPSAIILSGGPASVTAEDAPAFAHELLDLGVPILGICYGLQVLTLTLGGEVAPSAHREYGRAWIDVKHAGGLLANLDETRVQVWMSHGDHVSRPAPGFEVLAKSDDGVVAAVANRERRIWGVQFHPEVVHTPRGTRMLRNFLFDIAGLRGDWTPASFVDESIERIRDQVGDARVVCGLSGGVDSAVAAALIHRAIGARLTCVFVDNGLLRAGEAEEVVRTWSGTDLDFRHVDARERFISELAGISDPETKRKTIGRVFVEVFEDVANTIEGARFLAQGTLYPDVIESVSVRGPAAVISSSEETARTAKTFS